MKWVLKSDHAQTVTEVFHEFFKVDPLIPVDVSGKAESDDFFLWELDFSIPETLNVLVNLKEAILVAIVFLE